MVRDMGSPQDAPLVTVAMRQVVAEVVDHERDAEDERIGGIETGQCPLVGQAFEYDRQNADLDDPAQAR